MIVMIRNRNGDDFCEDAFGRDGHGHASKSKETLYFPQVKKNLTLFDCVANRHRILENKR
jgi:hypothetical protein